MADQDGGGDAPQVHSLNASDGCTAPDPEVFEAAALPMLLLALDGRILRANRAMLGLLGYAADELHEVLLGDLVAPESQTRLSERLAAVRAGEGPLPDVVTRVLSKSGGLIEFRTSKVAVLDEHGTPRYIVARALPDHL